MPLSVLLTGSRAERHASRAYYATRRLAARAMNGARNRMRISVIVISQIAPS
jgi:hypothetical protein